MKLEELLLKSEEVPVQCHLNNKGYSLPDLDEEGYDRLFRYCRTESYEVRLPVHHKLAEFIQKSGINTIGIADAVLREAMKPENLQKAFESEYMNRIKTEEKLHEIYSSIKKQKGKVPDYDDIMKSLQDIDYRLCGVSYVKIAADRFFNRVKALEAEKSSSLDVWLDIKEKLPEPEDVVLKENVRIFQSWLNDCRYMSRAISEEYYSPSNPQKHKVYNEVFVGDKESSGFCGLIVDCHKRVDLHIEEHSGVIEKMFNIAKEKFDEYYPKNCNDFSSSTHNSPDYDFEHAILAREWGIRYLNSLMKKMAEQKLCSQHLF